MNIYKKVQCNVCKGTGNINLNRDESNSESEIPCEHCHGTGIDLILDKKYLSPNHI